MISYNQFVGLLQNIANAHEQLRTFGEGDPWEIGASSDVVYPLMWVVPQPSATDKKVLQLKVSLLFADLVHKDISNQQEVVSDTLQIAMDVLAQLSDPTYDDDFILDPKTTLTPFNDKFDDEVSGWKADLTIKINFLSDRCAVPSLLTPEQISAACAPVIVSNSDGSYTVTFPSGTVNAVIPDSDVKNTAGTTLISLPATRTATIGDSVITDGDGTTHNVPATISYACQTLLQLMEASSTATLYNDLTTAGKLVGVINALTNADLGNLNNTQLTFIVSLLTTQLLSLSTTQLQYVLANCMSNAFLNTYLTQGTRNVINQRILNKTGQTISYATGDDGSRQNGFGTNFLILPLNNMFGNTSRFTDILGNQTYTVGYTIDHVTGLGWDFSDWGNIRTWASAISSAPIKTVNGVTYNDFFLPNLQEMLSILNYGNLSTSYMTYGPFIHIGTAIFWSSTTHGLINTQAFAVQNYSYPGVPYDKTNSHVVIYCRKHF